MNEIEFLIKHTFKKGKRMFAALYEKIVPKTLDNSIFQLIAKILHRKIRRKRKENGEVNLP